MTVNDWKKTVNEILDVIEEILNDPEISSEIPRKVQFILKFVVKVLRVIV